MTYLALLTTSVFCVAAQGAQEPDEAPVLEPLDVFQLEYAQDPRISPDGSAVAYVRRSMDIMKDRARAELWLVSGDGERHRPIVQGSAGASSPRWSPDGERLAYVSGEGGTSQIWLRWTDTGEKVRLTQLTESPSGLAWSPDGAWLSFSMRVPARPESFVSMPAKPEGAEWAPPAKVITKVRYRADGAGYLEDGYRHVFVLRADGGTPRQITDGDFDHGGTAAWTHEGQLIVSSNRRPGAEREPMNSELYLVELETGRFTQLTDRVGPDRSPRVSPDGRLVAWLGFDDQQRGYHNTQLWVMRLDGSGRRAVSARLDRSINEFHWSRRTALRIAAGYEQQLFASYDDRGDTLIAAFGLDGSMEPIASGQGGAALGRPYGSGSFSVTNSGMVAYPRGTAQRPADVTLAQAGQEPRTLTDLNADALGPKRLARVEEFWCESSHDGRQVQGWIAYPPEYDPESDRKWPLLLEIHGGPFANYGPRFSGEVQLFAAAGYVVVYTNPRGSTSYGAEFANLIHHAYPGNDYDDLMSCVDHVIETGVVDEERMFVTGGSGGGVLTSWIVGKTDRFRAAVVAKPVINWTSFALTADAYTFFWKYWFPGYPWDHPEHYWERSPLSLVGNVTTPTMLLTGEEDYRTPMSESEQYFQALQLREVPTALVRIPGASHGITARPSRLIAKVAHVLEWFELHDSLDG